MTTLCRFCRGEDGPNEATTTITWTGSKYPIAVCDDCLIIYNEQLRQDWLAEQGPDENISKECRTCHQLMDEYSIGDICPECYPDSEDMSDPAYNSHPAAMGRMP